MKQWVIGRADEKLAASLGEKCDLTPLCLKVLVSRGYTELDSIASLFSGGELESPFMLKDMNLAADTINRAVERFDRICVYGDYDCDGVTATAVLYSYLECCGANARYYIPERAEGYGMNKAALRSLAEDGVKLIVTVDNGVSALEEAELISELGMELVVTDHHQPGQRLPRAAAVVDPHRDDCPSAFKELAGVGVALKLCAALDGGDYGAVMEQYGDLAAIGTVADVVSLSGENRIIVRNGIRLLKNTENHGLISLMEKCSLDAEKLTASDLAFVIAPRINAAGRFGSPVTALKTLLSEEWEAEDLAGELTELNAKRKKCEADIIAEIKKTINEDPAILNEKVIIIAGKQWHSGVIGIVAAKLTEAYGKPAVLISIDGDGTARGSARSVKGFSIYRCFCSCEDLLERFGGHECAGGLSMKAENIPALRKRIAEYADTIGRMPFCELHADKLLTREDLTVGQIESLCCLEPFGEGNPYPLFAVIGAMVQKVTPLSQGKHTRLEVAYDSTVQTALCFGRSPDSLGVRAGDAVDMIVSAGVTEYNGRKSIALKVQDIRQSAVNQQKALSALTCYESFLRGEHLSEKLIGLITPQRSDFLEVYKALAGYRVMPLDMLMCRMYLKGLNFAKTRVCIDAFSQTGLVRMDAGERSVSIAAADGKVSLEDSPVMKALAQAAKEAQCTTV